MKTRAMPRHVALYARVSREEQAKGDAVSIPQQLAEMRALCERNRWTVINEFVDAKDYRATQAPKKGMIVNPSGERADRPEFLELLDLIKAGDVAAVLCWRDDRLVRHPRVAVALEDALDIGDAARERGTKVQILDATGSTIDRFTLSIKATIWREENKRRAERTKMGRVATLQQGRWPSNYPRLGYRSFKERGKRGRTIEIAEDEARVVLAIHEMYDSGVGTRAIRRYLINNRMEQKGHSTRKYDWTPTVIYAILRAEDYTGTATWNFSDGTTMKIAIPVIVPRDLWKRNQTRLERRKRLSTRNAKGVYLLQGLVGCGDCGRMMATRQKRYGHAYFCCFPNRYPNEPHPRPYNRSGIPLDWQVWRKIVDCGIKQPNLIRKQIQDRQAELQAQGDNVGSDIAHVRQRLTEIDDERAFFQRQAARGKITETEFDGRMEETEEGRIYWLAELDRLTELRDNRAGVRAGLDYAIQLLTSMQERLGEIDIQPDELRILPKKQRDEILRERRRMIQALCDRVLLYANGRVVIEGVLDGSEAAEFELASSTPFGPS